MYKYSLLIVLLFAYFFAKAQGVNTNDQHRSKRDSLNMKRDSATSKPFVPKVKPDKVYHPDSTHSPRKAVIRSLEFPGWGQVYNRHGLWWRLPAIYGGLVALAINIYSNGKDYNYFLPESEWRAHGRIDPATGQTGVIQAPDKFGNSYPASEPHPYYQGAYIGGLADQTIYDYKDNLRRNRDLSIFGFIGVWGIQAIDAYVEAKFIHSYTMDNDLSFKITPSFTAPTPTVYASNFNPTFTPSIKITFFLK